MNNFLNDKYAFYYDYESIGDVLLIVINSSSEIPNKVIKKDDVTILYKNDELIGINIFNISKVLKIKAKGFIPLVNEKILDVINHIIENAGLGKLPLQKESGFRVAKIIEIEDHPDSDHLHVCTVDVGDKEPLQIVCGAFNARKDLICVCAMPYTFMPNGAQIIPDKLIGIDSYGMLCSGRELNLEGYEGKRGLLELNNDYKVGTDFWTY